MFGRKKKKDEEPGIAGLPGVSVSIGDSSQNPPAMSPTVPSSPSGTPGEPTQLPGSSIPPIRARTTMTFDGGTTVIDARNVPGLRQELLDVISHGGNPAEIQDIVVKAMSQGHLTTAGTAPAGGAPTPPPPSAGTGDPLDRLKKLNELRLSGALTDAEFEAEKKKILDET